MTSATTPLLDSTATERIKSRVQFIQFATELLSRQHRTHLFTIYIFKAKARLFRWDRAGVVVTKLVDLTKEPRWLVNFIARFAAMTDEQQGYDTTAQLATKAEVDLMRACSGLNATAKRLLEEATADESAYPIFKVRLSRIAISSYDSCVAGYLSAPWPIGS